MKLVTIRASGLARYLEVLESLRGLLRAYSEAVELQWCFFPIELARCSYSLASELAGYRELDSEACVGHWALFNGSPTNHFSAIRSPMVGIEINFFAPFTIN